jgi:glyoxalase family protein
MEYWQDRLSRLGAAPKFIGERFGQRVLQFQDPDAMPLEIIAQPNSAGQPWPAGPIPVDYAIRAFHSVTISQRRHEATAQLLTDIMGFQLVSQEANRYRYRAAANTDGLAACVDLLNVPDRPHGDLGAGIVHHVAYRTQNDAQQLAWRDQLVTDGLNVSPVMDRMYFHSIYYREPGGVLFEIATENPGFTLDQPASELGTNLKLPTQFEPHRAALEEYLPRLRLTPPAELLVTR